MSTRLIGSRWDDEYRRGRYEEEPPLPLVQTILDTLQEHREVWEGVGLYVGCGNGRNYLPLVDAGCDMYGLDVSGEALKRLSERRPDQASRLLCGDFRSFRSDVSFSYLIAIQVFQHAAEADVALYFDNVASLLRPGGLFFLRVNSATTEVYHRHTVVERNRFGGFTVRYEDGPKRGLLVHFSSYDELLERTAAGFDTVIAPREDVIRRAPPKTGSWAQWEAAWRKRTTARPS